MELEPVPPFPLVVNPSGKLLKENRYNCTGDLLVEHEKESLEGFKPRPYQDQILDVCLKKNAIVYLPTGAGKTYIALMAMKYLAKDLDKSLNTKTNSNSTH